MDAPKKLCFEGKPHEVRPKGPQGAARELMLTTKLLRRDCSDRYSKIHAEGPTL